MTPEDRAHSYAKQMNIQRLKVANAYIKFLSYYSKLGEPELSEAMSDEDRETAEFAMRKMLQIIKLMNRLYRRQTQKEKQK